MRNFSQSLNKNINSVSSEESLLVCLEITHPSLVNPVRIVNDSVDLEIGSNKYIACSFDVSLPDDFEKQSPRANLKIDNIGKELVSWIERSGGARKTKCRILIVQRSNPSLVEFDTLLELTNINVSLFSISAQLGYDDILSLSAVKQTYRPTGEANAEGLF